MAVGPFHAAQPVATGLRLIGDPDGPRLAFSPEDWRAFTASVKAARFDLA
jgi:Domain of unknown function (DUF397)